MCVGEGVRAPDLLDSLTAVSTQLPAHFAAVRFLRGKKKSAIKILKLYIPGPTPTILFPQKNLLPVLSLWSSLMGAFSLE